MQRFEDFFGDQEGDALVRFGRDTGDVRRQQQVRAAGERMARGQRLGGEDIEGGAAELTALQRRRHRGFVDDTATSAVDQNGAALHGSDATRVEKAAGGVDERNVQADDIGRGDEGVERHRLDAGIRIGGVTHRQRRVEGNDAHADGLRQGRGALTDRAEADQPHRLAGDLAPARQGCARPVAGGHVGGRRIGAAQEQHRRGDHVFGDRVRVGACRRNHDDAAGGTGFDIDVVEADAEPPDDLAARHRREQRATDLGAVAHDQGVGASSLALEARCVVDERGVVQHIVRSGELCHRALVHELRDDDARHVADQADS